MSNGVRALGAGCNPCHKLDKMSNETIERELQERAADNQKQLLRALSLRHGFVLRRLHLITYSHIQVGSSAWGLESGRACSLIKQRATHGAPCVHNVTFGCLEDYTTLWTSRGCGGAFACGGRKVECGRTADKSVTWCTDRCDGADHGADKANTILSLYADAETQPTLTVITWRGGREHLLARGLEDIRHDAVWSDAVLLLRFDLEFHDPIATAAGLAANWTSIVLPFRNGNHFVSQKRCGAQVAAGFNHPRVPDTLYWVPRRYVCLLQWSQILREDIFTWHLNQSSVVFLSSEFADSNSAVSRNTIYKLNTRPISITNPWDHTVRHGGCYQFQGPWQEHPAWGSQGSLGTPNSNWSDTTCSPVEGDNAWVDDSGS